MRTAIDKGDPSVLNILTKIFPTSMENALIYATYTNKASAVLCLIRNGVNIDWCPPNDFPAIHYAARNGCYSIMLILLANGADKDLTTDTEYGSGWTPLHVAAYNGRTSVVKLLVYYGNISALGD